MSLQLTGKGRNEIVWIDGARLSDIQENQSQLVRANGKEIALFKIKGKIYALENACCHRGGPLAEGYLEGHEITCPWHAWTFDVRTGVCSTVPDTKHLTFKVKIEKGEVFVEA